MEKYEILPTEENLIEALYRDTIKRNKDIVYFYNILQAQESASTIAIDGRWGSGKIRYTPPQSSASEGSRPAR